jgi:hypothetical protein
MRAGKALKGIADQLAAIRLPARDSAFVIPWPTPGTPGAFIAFREPQEWLDFVAALDLDERIPDIVRAKFYRALRLLYLAWLEADLVKAAELLAMTTLELALRDRYGAALKGKRPPSFGTLLRHMVESGALSDAQIPMVARYGGTVVGRVSGAIRPSLREIRNSLTHGDPFDGLPHPGLIELVRDLITFAYRHYLAEASALSGPAAGTKPRR